MRTLRPSPSLTAQLGQLFMFTCLAVAGLGGCAADMATRPAIHRAGPAGGHNLSTLTPQELAFGVPTGAHKPLGGDGIESFLKPEQLKPAPRAQGALAKVTHPNAVPHSAMAMGSKAELSSDNAGENKENLGAEVPRYASLEFPLPTPMSEDAQRYGARESQSTELQEFRYSFEATAISHDLGGASQAPSCPGIEVRWSAARIRLPRSMLTLRGRPWLSKRQTAAQAKLAKGLLWARNAFGRCEGQALTRWGAAKRSHGWNCWKGISL